MCFSNLPVEFDEEGNPTLTDEAEDVDRPGVCTHTGDCDCAADDTDIEADPRGTYETIVASLPNGAREHVERGDHRTRDQDTRPVTDQPDATSAGSD